MQDDTLGTTGSAIGADSAAKTDETDRLIASNKVEGTAVYNRQGERLGSIYNFMVDKRSGQVEYAVMSFGGFLGIGENYYPLPWKALTYDTSHGRLRRRPDKDGCRGRRATRPARTRIGATRLQPPDRRLLQPVPGPLKPAAGERGRAACGDGRPRSIGGVPGRCMRV